MECGHVINQTPFFNSFGYIYKRIIFTHSSCNFQSLRNHCSVLHGDCTISHSYRSTQVLCVLVNLLFSHIQSSFRVCEQVALLSCMEECDIYCLVTGLWGCPAIIFPEFMSVQENADAQIGKTGLVGLKVSKSYFHCFLYFINALDLHSWFKLSIELNILLSENISNIILFYSRKIIPAKWLWI